MSSKYSEQDRQSILAEARETVARLHSRDAERWEDGATTDPPVDPPPTEVRFESLSMRHRRELLERDQAWQIERECERLRERRERQNEQSDLDALAQRVEALEAKLSDKSALLADVVEATSAFGSVVENKIAELRDVLHEMRLAQAKLEKSLLEMRLDASGKIESSMVRVN